jgi:hypothetical protein
MYKDENMLSLDDENDIHSPIVLDDSDISDQDANVPVNTQEADENAILSKYLMALKRLHREGKQRKEEVSAKSLHSIIYEFRGLDRQLLKNNPKDKDRTIFHYLLSVKYDEDFESLFDNLFEKAQSCKYDVLSHKLAAHKNAHPVDPLQYAIMWHYEKYAILLIDKLLISKQFSSQVLKEISNSLINCQEFIDTNLEDKKSITRFKKTTQICRNLATHIINSTLENFGDNQKGEQRFFGVIIAFVNAIKKEEQRKKLECYTILLELWFFTIQDKIDDQNVKLKTETAKELLETLSSSKRLTLHDTTLVRLVKLLAWLISHSLVEDYIEDKDTEPFLHTVIKILSGNQEHLSRVFVEGLDTSQLDKIIQQKNKKSYDNTILAAAHYGNILILKGLLSKQPSFINSKNHYGNNLLGKFFRNPHNTRDDSKFQEILSIFNKDNLLGFLFEREQDARLKESGSAPIEKVIDDAREVGRRLTLTKIGEIVNYVGDDELRRNQNKYQLVELIIKKLDLFGDHFFEKNNSQKLIFIRIVRSLHKDRAIEVFKRAKIERCDYQFIIDEAFNVNIQQNDQVSLKCNIEKEQSEPVLKKKRVEKDNIITSPIKNIKSVENTPKKRKIMNNSLDQDEIPLKRNRNEYDSEDLSHFIDLYSQEIKDLKQTIIKINNEVDEKNTELLNGNKILDSQRSKIEQLEEDNTALNEIKTTQEYQIVNFIGNTNQYQKTIESLQSDLNEESSLVEEKNKELEKLQNKYSRIQKTKDDEINDLNIKLLDSNTMLDFYRSKTEQLEKDNTTLNEVKSTQEVKIENLEQNINKYQKNVEDLQSRLDEKVSSADEKNRELETLQNNLSKVEKTKIDEITKLKATLAVSQNKLIEEEASKKSLEEKYNLKVNDLECKIKELHNESQITISQLHKKIAELKCENESNKCQFETAKQKIASFFFEPRNAQNKNEINLQSPLNTANPFVSSTPNQADSSTNAQSNEYLTNNETTSGAIYGSKDGDQTLTKKKLLNSVSSDELHLLEEVKKNRSKLKPLQGLMEFNYIKKTKFTNGIAGLRQNKCPESIYSRIGRLNQAETDQGIWAEGYAFLFLLNYYAHKYKINQESLKFKTHFKLSVPIGEYEQNEFTSAVTLFGDSKEVQILWFNADEAHKGKGNRDIDVRKVSDNGKSVKDYFIEVKGHKKAEKLHSFTHNQVELLLRGNEKLNNITLVSDGPRPKCRIFEINYVGKIETSEKLKGAKLTITKFPYKDKNDVFEKATSFKLDL